MGTIEQDGEVKIIVRLTVLDDESNANNEDVISDVEIWMTKGGCVAELKAILESQDLLPGETDNKLIDGQPSFVIEVRLPSTSALLQDDDNIPEEATTVDVVVRHPGKDLPASTSQSPYTQRIPLARSTSSITTTPFPPPTSPAFPANLTPLAAPLLNIRVLAPSSFLTSLMSPSMPQTTSPNLQEAFASNLMNDPSMMRQLMNSPVIRSMMSNPDLLRSLMDANPQMRELRERNPELNHLLNDPELLRQSMEAMQNPSLMREMISNTDRALSNIDAVPGGFNALRRVYQQIQEPIWDAALGNDLQGRNSSTETAKHYDLQTDKKPSTEAIPNPWARRSAPVSNTAVSANAVPTTITRQPLHTTESIPAVLSTSRSSGSRPHPSSYPNSQGAPSHEPPSTSTTTHRMNVQPSVRSTREIPVSPNSQSSIRSNESSSQEPSNTDNKMAADETSGKLSNELSILQLPTSPSSSFTQEEALSTPSSEFPPSDHQQSIQYPMYSFQSFFNSNPHLRLRSLGGMSLPNASHISGRRNSQELDGNTSTTNEVPKNTQSRDEPFPDSEGEDSKSKDGKKKEPSRDNER